MSRTLEKPTLRDLKAQFNLTTSTEPTFFPEWHENLPSLSAWEQQRLDRIYATYVNLSEDDLMEETLKLAIVSPILDLVDFFLPPFRVSAEEQVQLSFNENSKIYRVKIDIFVLRQQIWLLVIESKRQAFSLSVGIPQALTYMLAQPIQKTPKPLYGMVTNGSNFVFIKLMNETGNAQYAKSNELLMEKLDDRIQILQILKQIGQSCQD
jgi:hypothetical protein